MRVAWLWTGVRLPPSCYPNHQGALPPFNQLPVRESIFVGRLEHWLVRYASGYVQLASITVVALRVHLRFLSIVQDAHTDSRVSRFSLPRPTIRQAYIQSTSFVLLSLMFLSWRPKMLLHRAPSINTLRRHAILVWIHDLRHGCCHTGMCAVLTLDTLGVKLTNRRIYIYIYPDTL